MPVNGDEAGDCDSGSNTPDATPALVYSLPHIMSLLLRPGACFFAACDLGTFGAACTADGPRSVCYGTRLGLTPARAKNGSSLRESSGR